MLAAPAADTPRVSDESDTTAGSEQAAPEHPLQRAHKFFQKAAPVIREVNDAIEGGALEQVRDTVVERANDFVQKVDDAVANATAIEGDVIERVVDEPAAAAADPASAGAGAARSPSSTAPSAARWITIGVVAAAATYGALKLQRRRA